MQAKYMGSGSASESSPLIMVKVSVCCALDGKWHYRTILVRGCWWASGDCEHRV